jgi:basic membrane protein A
MDYSRDRVLGIETLMHEDCDLIIAPSWSFLTTVEAAVRDDPEQHFVLFGAMLDSESRNVWSQSYKTDQAAFMAGYLAASVSQSEKVATFGGLRTPQVLDFMVGFEQGIQYYNKTHGTDVELLGWDSSAGKGEFVGGFCCDPEGYKLAQQMIDQSADVIFPVAGESIGAGALAAIREGRGVLFIGVDIDQVEATPELAPWILTSVLKHSDQSVLHIAEAYEAGEFTGGVHFGTLENGEVGLAPFYENEDLISSTLKAELEAVKQGIISGEIQTKP